MKSKSLVFLASLVFFLQFLTAQDSFASEVVAPPRYVNTRGADGFKYFFMKLLVGDVDGILKKQGIDSAFCTFRPQDGSEDLPYRELGKCLMKNFLVAMKTDQKPGVIYTWVQDSKGRFHSSEIHWRPPVGGWSNIIRQVYEMKFEKLLSWARKDSLEVVNFKEFIVGDLLAILPEDPAALETLAANGNEMVKNYLRNLKSVSISLKTTSKPQGQMIYSGPVVLKMKSAEAASEKTVNIQLTTNVNIMLKQRPFYLRSKIVTGDAENFELGARP